MMAGRAFGWVGLMVWLAVTLAAGGTAKAEPLEIFGTVAMPMPPNTDLAPFTKWNDMIRRFEKDRGWENTNCGAGDCPPQLWKKIQSESSRLGRPEQITAVNRHVNKVPYVPDSLNWGGIDYWETPKEFFYKGGECKDYAIAKYFALRALGWPTEALWLIILQDMNLNVTHAVLAVRTEGKTLIMDNQVSEVVEEGRIHHYRPIFGLDEGGWFLFRPR